MQDIRVQGVFVGPRQSFEDMNRALAKHELKPVVDRAFSWAEAQDALNHVGGGNHFGKVCITVNDGS